MDMPVQEDNTTKQSQAVDDACEQNSLGQADNDSIIIC